MSVMIAGPGRVREHELSVALTCDADDIRVVLHGVTRALSQVYEETVVPQSMTIHHDGDGRYRWTWQTAAPAAVGETPR